MRISLPLVISNLSSVRDEAVPCPSEDDVATQRLEGDTSPGNGVLHSNPRLCTRSRTSTIAPGDARCLWLVVVFKLLPVSWRRICASRFRYGVPSACSTSWNHTN